MKKNKMAVANFVTQSDFTPFIPTTSTDLTAYKPFPLAKIGELGDTFKPVMNALQTVVKKQKGNSTSNSTAPQEFETLYRAVYKKKGYELGKDGVHLAEFHDKSGLLGSVVKDKVGVIGQAHLEAVQVPVNPTSPSVPSPTLAPVNPAMIAMATMLMSIDKKLDVIQETNEKILAFLEEKERATMEGNLEILSDVFNNYKFNLDNQLYKTNKHIQVQAIKAEAEHSVKLYRSQIQSACEKKKNGWHGDQDVNTVIEKIEKLYNNYQLALYVYAFAYFIEVILFENYDKGYLDSVSNSIEKHCADYENLYKNFREMIESYSKSSVQSYTVKALSNISKGTSKVVSKISLFNKTKLEQNLLSSGEKLDKAGEARTERIVDGIFSGDTNFIAPFQENIHTINVLYNEPMEILVGQDTLYIKNA